MTALEVYHNQSPSITNSNFNRKAHLHHPSMAHSSSPLDSSRVSDTNPDTIKALWTDVASVVSMSSRGQPIKNGRRGGAGGGRAGGGSRAGSDVGKEASPSASVPTSVFDPSESRHTPESTATHTTRTISPRHANFSKLVLHPRAITINDTNSIVPSAFAHFGTNEPPDGEVVDYTQLVALGGAAHNFWVVLDDDAVGDIAAEYREMRGLGLCEEEFATFAKTHFLRGELRSRNVSEDRQWRAERMLQLVCPPKENAHWRVPPVMVTSDSPRDVGEAPELWSWDIRPDCAYWLSLRGFNPRYRFQIQNCTFIRDWITCPYLSVEFKRDGESEDVAVRQVCAAGALALFNRCYLHLEARKAATPNKSLVGNNLVNTEKRRWRPSGIIP